MICVFIITTTTTTNNNNNNNNNINNIIMIMIMIMIMFIIIALRTPRPQPQPYDAAARRSLSLPQALSLQKELLKGFSDEQFQRRLERLEETLAGAQFMKERNKLFQTVQTAVLPEYSFEGSPEGVLQMVCAPLLGAASHLETHKWGCQRDVCDVWT